MINLSEIPTTPPKGYSKKKAKKELDKMAKEIGELVTMMRAQRKHSLLVVMQGMDSSGKDGSTREVFKYCSPSMVSAIGYGKPTDEAMEHDFLWRVGRHAPRKGNVKVFVRSHYEDILIQRVHKWIDEDRVDARMKAINAWENLLQDDNNTTVMKFYLHLSYERQGEKLQERIDVPEKNWKHNPGDWEERKLWDEYRRCYEDAINRSDIPWIIAPVDSRTYRNHFVATKVLEQLRSFNMEYPILKDNE